MNNIFQDLFKSLVLPKATFAFELFHRMHKAIVEDAPLMDAHYTPAGFKAIVKYIDGREYTILITPNPEPK